VFGYTAKKRKRASISSKALSRCLALHHPSAAALLLTT